jgi:hypothetical protein
MQKAVAASHAGAKTITFPHDIQPLELVKLLHTGWAYTEQAQKCMGQPGNVPVTANIERQLTEDAS